MSWSLIFEGIFPFIYLDDFFFFNILFVPCILSRAFQYLFTNDHQKVGPKMILNLPALQLSLNPKNQDIKEARSPSSLSLSSETFGE